MKDHIQSILMWGLMAVALLVLGALYIWVPVCDGLLELANGNLVHMKCFYTSQATSVLAVLVLVAAISALITKQTHAPIIIAIGILLIVITYQSFLGIGICMKETMACHQTAFWIRGGGVLTILLGILACFKKQKNSSKES
ncbi:hypothetical protein Desdi_0755 [Desulfitobacterium dichloroeliminans LMG P-21439]|uniref:DUF4418 domain-containing protein n=1 Tax=Desulfitobacterium dichloroeliminans (strain LMG P-21439 / DCA1) TaxID=871963 RepID=L0F512_DESDL|nr:DUF4418 family protein [Desulfitobacterium dichloroeliminans]AGA68282.1 hypothetical protein Desdi_0755 [Desulfitobacterium dichloroeliminans LMG P-21439]